VTSGAYPASLQQQRLWFIEQLVPGTAQHNLSVQFRVHGGLDVPALERAVNRVIGRHEVLRTCFSVVAGLPVQVVLDEARVAIRPRTASGSDQVLPMVEAFAREPFDLTRTPLVRAALIRGGGTAVLVFVLHHIAVDGWSIGIFLREVAEFYRGELAGDGGPDLPELPLQYVDYAIWQRERAASTRARERRAEQLRALDGYPVVLDLPTDRPRPAVQNFAGSSLSWRVPSALAGALEQFARRHGATMHMMLLATFAVVLNRWSRQSRLLVATPAANRVPVETEQLIGFFANTLAVPADLSGNRPFAEILERVRDASLGAVSRQDVPFEELVESIAPDRTLSHNPLVQVMMILQNVPGQPLELPGAGLEQIDIQSGTSQFDLVLDVTPLDDGLDCMLQYSTDLFDRITVERFSRHLSRLWETVTGIAAPDTPVGDIELSDQRERAELARLGTGPHLPPNSRPLPRRLAATALRTPGAVAVRAPDGSYTYGQYLDRASAIGTVLTACGLRPGDLVGVAMPRSHDLPAALLGVWQAGGAYVPLDPSYPQARLQHMMRDAGIKVLLTARGLAAQIPVPPGTEVIQLDDSLPMSGSANDGSDRTDCATAYVIYTSGSTGQPKGVVVGHPSLANLLDDFAAATRFGPRDRMLALTSLSFDIAGLEIWLPLLTGGTLVIAPPGTGGNPEVLHQMLGDEGITVVQATPATWKLYTAFTAAAPPGLRQIWSGGEHLPHAVARALTALGPEIHNLYGPTETTIWSTRAVLRTGDEFTGIGRPLSNTLLFVTDESSRPVPLGVPGELRIGGAGLAHGYLGRPALTTDRFTKVQGVPAYRTGDLVRWRSSGNLEYLGRLDDQVKIRGHRVEPAEVDAAARSCPDVRDACTVTIPSPTGDDSLVTFVTPDTGPDDRVRQGNAAADDWRAVWDSAYGEGDPPVNDDLDLRGWKSSYTKRPLPAAEMREWAEQAVGRIARTGARSFAEIGCGTGLLLLRLAPDADCYLGIDFSAGAIAHVQKAITRRGIADRVRLAVAAADQIAAIADGRTFDCVILNSVAQYFPSRDYLTAVLAKAASIVAPGGHLFIGDLRSLPLAAAFHASVLEADERLPAAQIPALADRRVLEEDELLVDPGYFTALRDVLPDVTGIQVSLKPSGYDNEMTRFRYDVLLRISGEPPLPPATVEEHAWDTVGGIPGLEKLLGASAAAAVVIDDIPNDRVARFVHLVDGGPDSDASIPSPVRLASLEDLAAQYGRDAHYDWSSRDRFHGRVRATFTRAHRDGTGDTAFLPCLPVIDGPTTSNPRQGALLRVLSHTTRTRLRQDLPDYMVPGRVYSLPDLPMTPNGKIDRKALKAIAREQPKGTGQVPPQDPVQDLLHALWCELLGLPRISVTENIFDVGATSLLIVRVRQELRDRHDIDVPLTAFFAHPTISALAQSLQPGGESPRPDERATRPRSQDTAAAQRRRRAREKDVR
jgi:amino acid adenylation domain-containing protein